MSQEDRETILFELGFIWGALAEDDRIHSGALDSCETIKAILDKYREGKDK